MPEVRVTEKPSGALQQRQRELEPTVHSQDRAQRRAVQRWAERTGEGRPEAVLPEPACRI